MIACLDCTFGSRSMHQSPCLECTGAFYRTGLHPNYKPKTERKADMFTKDDLKTGMVVECEKGNLYTVMLNTQHGDVICGKTGFMRLRDFDINLQCIPKDYSVVKIFKAPFPKSMVTHESLELIWQREPQKVKVIIDDIEMMLPADKAEKLKQQLRGL